MSREERIAVTSRSFSRNPQLRAELLQRYPRVTFNDAGLQLAGAALVAFLRGHSKAITALERLDEPVLAQLPELEVIAKYGVGLDMLDLGAMRRLGKRLGWRPGVNRRAVAELALALAIVMLREVPAAHRELLAGTWRQRSGGLLSGRTVGVVGCGCVGQELVRLLEPFGCVILVHDIVAYPEFYARYAVEPVGLHELLRRADVVTLHVPLDESTRDMLTRSELELMKPSAVLINTARGGIVDESAVRSALSSGRLAAAAFDVFGEEPPTDAALIGLPNFLATPHIGGSAHETMLLMGRAAIDGLDDNRVP
jgi:phosphoglycerate dehydrogenase-like enzyme